MKTIIYSPKLIQKLVLILLLIASTAQQTFAQCGAASAFTPTVSSTSVCSGTQVYLYANGLPVVNWIYRNNNTGNWISFSSNSETTSQFVSVSVPTIRTYRAVLSTANCSSDTTAGIDISVIMPSYGNNTSILLSATNQTACAGSLVTVRMMNQGFQPVSWLYRDNNGSWFTLTFTSSNAISVYMPSLATILVRDFRVLVRNPNSCQQDSSAIVSITVNPSAKGNNVLIKPTSTQTSVCGGTSVNLQLDWSLDVGNWIYRDSNNGNWQTFSSNTTNVNDFNTNVNASVTREYRAILISPNSCMADTSAGQTVLINASAKRVLTSILPRFTNANLTQVCAGNSVSMQLQGYNNLSWFYRDSINGNWLNFSSSSSPSLGSSNNITKSLNREIRVVVNNAANTCSVDTSASIFYTVRANVRGNATTIIPFTPFAELCIGAAATVYMPSGQSISTWLTRNNNSGTWQNTFNSSTNYTENTPNSFTANTLRSYRAVINNTNLCSIDSTPEVQVLYRLPIPGSTVAITPTITQTAICASTNVQANISTTNGQAIKNWVFRDNNVGLWNEIPFSNSTFLSHSTNNIISSTIRSYRALITNLETFTVDTSLEVVATINPISYGTTPSTPTTLTSIICNENSILVNIVLPAGYTLNRWIYRDTINQGWLNAGTSTTLNNFIFTTRPTRTFRAILLNQSICKFDTSNALVVTVTQKINRVNTAYQPTTTIPTICSGSSINVQLNSLPSGVNVLRWVSRDNGSVWRVINTSSTNYFESTNNTRVLVNTNREYRAILNDNNNCFTDTSAPVFVTINPLANGVTSGISPTTNIALNCAGTAIQVNINSYNGSIQKWQYKDNGGSWKEFENNTQSSFLNDNNTYLSALTNREYRAVLIRPNSCIIDTTQVLTTQIKPYSYGNVSAIQPASSQPNICSGNLLNMNIPFGNSYGVHKWIVQYNPTAKWSEINNSSPSTSFNESNTSVIATSIRSYRAIILTNACSYDTTSAINIQINPRSYGYASAITITSSIGVYCAGSTINANIINSTLPSGASVRNWLFMDNISGNWFGIQSSASTFLSHSQTNVLVPTTRSYRAIINNTATCSFDSSNIFSVSINPSSRGFATTITPTISNNNICNATTTPGLQVSLPSGYSILKWVVNNNNTGWTDFGYNTQNTFISDFFTTVLVPTNRNYRAIVVNNSLCSIDSTNIVSATINPAVRGILSSVTPFSDRTNYCYTKSVVVSLSTPSGYFIEKWIVSDNGLDYIDFSATTSSSISDNNTFVAITTSRSFRVILFNNSTCQRDTTAALTVIINPRANSIGLRTITPTSFPATGLCSGSSINLTINPGTGNEVMKWTYSNNGNSGPWYDALGSYNSSSFTHNLTQSTTGITRLYRAIITDTSGCDFDSTQSLAVNITPITNGRDTSITINGLDSVCVGTVVSLSIAPGSGNSVNKWIYRDNSSPWQNFISSTTSSFLSDANTQVAPGTIRGYTPLVFKTSTCSIDTLTKVKNVVLKIKTYGNGTAFVNVTADTVCSGNSLFASTSGTVERWLYRNGNNGVWLPITNTSTFLSHNETAINSSTWRYYRALINTGTCNADTTQADSVFLKVLGYGNMLLTPTTPNPIVCAGNGVSLSLSIFNATIQRWLYRDNNAGGWVILSNTSNTGITDFNTTVTSPISRAYRVLVFRTCSYDTTDALVVTINPKTRGKDLTKIPSATSATVCTASPIQNIQVNAGSGNSIVEWLYRNNTSSWLSFANGNQNNLSDFNTLTGVSVTRQYVAIINNNTTCSFDTTAPLTVTINPIVLGNSPRAVSAATLACMGSSYTVSMNVQSDSTVIRFLYNNNGGSWIDRGYISPSASNSFSDFAYNSSASYTVGYRALIYKAGTCRIDTTAPLTVTVNPRVYGNDNTIAVSGASTACSGTSFSVNVSLGSGNSISKWLFNENGGAWNDIFISSASVNHSAIATSALNRQYRALIIKGNACTIDSSAARTVTINPLVYGTDTVAQISITSAKPGCTGNFVSVSTSPGSGNSINSWLFRNAGGNWNNMFLSSNSITDYNTFTSAPINRIYGAVIWKSATCRLDTTRKIDTINISPRMNRYDSTISVTSTLTNACLGTAVPLTVSVGSNTVERWLFRNNGGVWNVLSNSTSSSIIDFNTAVTTTTTREYRIIVRKAAVCAFDTSMGAIVTLTPRTAGTDASIIPTANNATNCSGSILNLSVNAGTNNTIQKWIFSTNGSVWQDFAFTSSSTINDFNTTVNTSTTRSYKAIILKGSGCSTDSSATVTVTINPVGFGTQNSVIPVASNTVICSGGNVNLSVNGFVGNSVSRWLYRNQPTDAWTVVNSSSTVFADFNTATTTTFVRQYRAIINNNTGCSTDSSAIASVSINPITNGVIALPTQVSQTSVCAGTPVNIFTNPPVGRIITGWLHQDTAGWLPLNVSNSSSVNDFATIITANLARSYRALLRNIAGCSIDSSTSVSVNINIISQGTNLGITPNTTTPSLCSGTNAVVSVSGFSGSVVRWLYRDTLPDFWSVVNNTGFTLFHTNTFVAYPRTRQYRAIVYNPNNCSNDTTAAVQVQLNPLLAGNANAIAPTITTTAICTGTSISMSAAGFINGGVVTGWVFSDNGAAPIRIAGVNNATIVHAATNVTALTTRVYRALVFTSCSTDTTAGTSVTIDVFPVKPNVGIANTTDSLVCSENAATYQWKLNGNNISGATAKVWVAAQSGNYRVEIGNTAGCKTTSDAITHLKVGLEDVLGNLFFTLYPNPTFTGNAVLQFSNTQSAELIVAITDMEGKRVMQQQLNTATTNQLTIDITNEKAGIYFITLTNNSQSKTYKLIYSK